MENTGNVAWLHGLWHLTLSALSVLLMWRILLGDSVGFSYEDLQRNPVVVHHLLWIAPIMGAVTATMFTTVHASVADVHLFVPAGFQVYVLALAAMFTAV